MKKKQGFPEEYTPMTAIRHEAHPHDDLTRAESPVDAVARATTCVRTHMLERNGIESLRILSESKFLELLRKFAERGEPKMAETPPLNAASEKSDLEEAYRKKWSELKAQHEASLQRIEGRMEKLSRVFQGLQGVLAASGAQPAVREAAPPQPIEPKQRALLREMLLEGDRP